MQSESFDTLYENDSNVIISAPTAAGKTVLLELALVWNFLSSWDPTENWAVYLAPIKALCSEKFDEWQWKFSSSLGINVVECTGDSDYTNWRELDSAAIIVATPEKWDSLTWKWKENQKLIGSLSLILVDEVHTIGDKSWGATLEVVLSRLLTLWSIETFKNKTLSQLRIIAISATIPNIEDLSLWLKCPKFLWFDEQYRPVKIK